MKKTKKISLALYMLQAAVLLAAIFMLPFNQSAFAATQITNRKLTLAAGTTDGGSKPGGNVHHDFSFDLHDTTDALGSISFQYCTTAAPVPGGIGCIVPTGLDISGVNLGTQGGATGFGTTTKSSVCDSSCGINNVITIGRGSASTIAADPTSVNYGFTGVVNPTTANKTFFVRITTYTSTNGTGTSLEAGTVAASTTNQIVLSGTMPESLVFCTGAVISDTASVPDCSTATSGNISFDRLFSPVDTALASSQMAASTNAGDGYSITVNGATLTSGANTISGMSTAGVSSYGVSQFGMNLVNNDGTAYTNAPNLTTMPTGEAPSADVTPTTNGTNYNATVAASYDAGGTHNGYFAFNDGDVVATSNSKGTDAQKYTASYIANVPGSLPAGTYSTTLTYICTPTF